MKPPAKDLSEPEHLTEDTSEAQVQTLFKQGFALHQKGRLAEAQETYQKVLRINRKHFDALYLLGLIASQSNNHPHAVELIDRAIEINPSSAEAHFSRGNLVHHFKSPEETLVSYEQAIALQPDYVEAHFNRAIVLQELGRSEEALAGHDQVIKLRPDYAEAHYHRGNALRELRWFGAALASYQKAIELKPDYVQASNNRGNVLKELGREEEALASYEQAIALQPDYAEAHYNRGNVLQDLKRLGEALNSYEQAVKFKPDHVLAHYNLSICRLLTGDFARGWEGYEWRWKKRQLEKKRTRDFTQPLWLGKESLVGKTILLYGEQGLGDTLQFCRYAKMVSELGACVIMEVPKPLFGLLENLDGVAHLVAKGSALPTFDYHCPLMSLPLAFKTDLKTLPAPDRYIDSNPSRVTTWQNRLGPKTKPRVGLAWSGAPWNKERLHRSIGLAMVRSLLCEEIEWFSLHKEVSVFDAELLSSSCDICHFGDEMNFVETAAVVELMDLVISVDTSIAHLAGSMGKPVWILLPFMPDWRWLLDSEDSPWYPSARLWRQDTPGDWAKVMQNVKLALQTWLSATSGNN